MIDAIHSWICQLTGAALISAAAISITPEGAVKRVVKLICGFVSVMVLLSIGTELDIDRYVRSVEEYRADADELASEAYSEAENMKRAIIEERSAAYILDKAEKTGVIGASVTVEARQGEDGCWYPWSAEIYAAASDRQRRGIVRYAEEELGIPEERQKWSEND